MKRHLAALLLLVILADGASAQENVRQLTLKEAIQLAVEKNLDVRAELYNPASAEADIHKYQGIYNPLLNLLLSYQDANTQLSNSFSSGVSVSRVRTETYNAGVTQLLPTGATVDAKFENTWNHNNFERSGILNNYFQSDVYVKATQPLLKNFGKVFTELNIDVAKFNKEGALDQFRVRLLDVISQVMIQYNRLYSLRKNVESKQTALKLAETILNNTQAQVKAGVLPAMEILNSRYGVALQQKNVIDAERSLKDQVDALRVLLQLQDVTDIIPSDVPFRDDYVIDEARSIGYALVPQLDLTAKATFSGLDTAYSRDLERVGSGRYPTWYAELLFTYPIGNDAARNDYIKSKLKVDQTLTQIRSLEDSIGRDVRIAARGVRSGYQQLDVTARGRAYADEVLQAYIKKQKVGLATTKDVLDVLNNQVTAEASEIQAVADYNNAVVNFWKTTGELLERQKVTLNGKEADDLYARNR